MAVKNPLRQPMRVGEIVPGAWNMFRRSPNNLMIMGAAAALPSFVSSLVVTPILERLPAYTGIPEFTLTTSDWLTLAGVALPLSILEFLLLSAVYRAVFDLSEAGTFSLLSCYARMVRRIVALLIAGLIAVVFPSFLVGTLLFIPVAIFLFVAWSLAPSVVVIESAGPLGGLKRSWHLVRRNWWHTLAVLLMLFLTVRMLPVLVVFGMLGFLFQNPLSQSLIAFVVNAVTMPLLAAGIVALYFDLRARKGEFIGSSEFRSAEPVSPGEGA